VAPRMRTFRDTLAAAQGDSISMSVLRAGQMLDISVKLTRGFGGGPPKAGVFPSYAWDTTLLASPMKEVGTLEGKTVPTIAAGIPDGLLPASRWISVDNHPVANWNDVWERFRAATAAGSADIAVRIQNPNSETQIRFIELPLTEQDAVDISQLEWKSPLPSFLFDPVQVIRTSDGNPVRALAMGAHETWRFIELTYLTIDRLIRGSVGVDQLHGPVGIVHLGTRVADRGFAWMLFFLAIISVNLAVLNFLPLPIVDGGMFLYLVYEKLRGRPPPAAFQNAAMLVGLLLIGTAFFVTFYNDLVRLLG
ncbi:MAG: RIP metalloprotease, partial [Phycisphaerales bacterium]|nr:RIP metalloprotease [Phycisphaerales bacterium]